VFAYPLPSISIHFGYILVEKSIKCILKKGIIGGGEGVALGASTAPAAVDDAAAPMAAMSPRCRQIKENPEIGIWKMDLFFFEKIDLIAYTTFLETLKFNEV